MSEPTWHRLSPRMLLVHPITETVRALPALAGLFFAGASNGHHYWSAIGAAVVVLLSLTRWFTTRLSLTAEQIQLRHGLLRRRTVAAARSRIRTVDVTSHVLHRLLGLSRVVIGTGTNDRKGKGHLVLDGLTVAAATALRDELLNQRAMLVERRDAGDAEPDPNAGPAADRLPRPGVELARLDRRWILLAPLTLSGVLTGLVIWGFYWRVQSESGVNLLRAGPFRWISHGLERLPTLAAVLLVLAATVIFIAVTSTAGYILAFWNFRLVRHIGGTVEATRGLLTTRATSIERRRLVGVALSEPLPLRCAGAARTTVIATGLRTGRGSDRGGEVLLPPAPLTAAIAVAGAVLDDAAAVTIALCPHPRAARRRRLIRAVGSGAGCTAASITAWQLGAPGWAVAPGLALLGASIPLGLDRYRSLGHASVDGYLATRYGSLVRRREILANTAVIGWNVRTTVFQRRLGLVTLTATTAAGRQGYRVTDVDPDTALSLADATTPGLLDQFRVARALSRPPQGAAALTAGPGSPARSRGQDPDRQIGGGGN